MAHNSEALSIKPLILIFLGICLQNYCVQTKLMAGHTPSDRIQRFTRGLKYPTGPFDLPNTETLIDDDANTDEFIKQEFQPETSSENTEPGSDPVREVEFEPSQLEGQNVLTNSNGDSLTPNEFLAEAEKSLRAKGVSKGYWHILSRSMLPDTSELALWLDSQEHQITSWDDFKNEVMTYDSSYGINDRLSSKLFSLYQKEGEAFEAFAQRVQNLFQKVNPDVTEKEIVSRILGACHPEIAVELAVFQSSTIAELVKDAEIVIEDLNESRQAENESLFRIRQTDSIIEQPEEGNGFHLMRTFSLRN